jgi:hypothetical protein
MGTHIVGYGHILIQAGTEKAKGISMTDKVNCRDRRAEIPSPDVKPNQVVGEANQRAGFFVFDTSRTPSMCSCLSTALVMS